MYRPHDVFILRDEYSHFIISLVFVTTRVMPIPLSFPMQIAQIRASNKKEDDSDYPVTTKMYVADHSE